MTEQKQISLQDAFKIQNQWLRKAIEIIEEDRKIITELVGIINSKSNSKLTISTNSVITFLSRLIILYLFLYLFFYFPTFL